MKQIKIPDTDCQVELFLFDCPGQGVFNKLDQVSGQCWRVRAP